MRTATLAARLSLAAILLLAASARAAPVDDLPAIGDRCVIDQANLLNQTQQRQLLDLCKQLNRAGVAQLAVATVLNLGDRQRSDFAADLFKKWKLGHGKKRSDGLLILVAPSTSHPWGMRVEVGYGLEGTLPDGKVGAMLDQFWAPPRDRQAYGEGIVAVAQALAGSLVKDAAAGGDAAPTDESRASGQRRGPSGASGSSANPAALGLAILAMLALLIALAGSALRKQFPGKLHGAAAIGLTVLTIGGLLSMASAGGGWIAFFIGLVVNGLTYFSIKSHKCPKDGSWMTIDEEIVDHPTYFSTGLAVVQQRCTSAACGYHNSYEKILPQKQIVVSSGGGGGGGGDGPGDSDSFSGGGGESGGGGADRD